MQTFKGNILKNIAKKAQVLDSQIFSCMGECENGDGLSKEQAKSSSPTIAQRGPSYDSGFGIKR